MAASSTLRVDTLQAFERSLRGDFGGLHCLRVQIFDNFRQRGSSEQYNNSYRRCYQQ